MAVENHPLYIIYRGIIARCYWPNAGHYKDYGGRGIKMCDRWLNSFHAFAEDMGERPSKSHSIDRIDNDKGYSPENCRWATKKEQLRNTRKNRRLTYNGETKTMKEWSEITGIKYPTFKLRVKQGWDIHRIMNEPVDTKEVDLERIISLYQSGMTMQKISLETGHAMTTISNRINELIKLGKAERRKPGKLPGSCKSLTVDGVTKKVNDWALEYKIPVSMILERIRHGWSVKDAITRPHRYKSKRII